MSAPNFHKKNASKYYVITPRDNLEFDCEIETIQETIKAETKDFEWVNLDKHDNKRNYGGLFIGKLYKEIEGFDIGLKAIVRSGYYKGSNLDWEIDIVKERDRISDLSDLTSVINYYYENESLEKKAEIENKVYEVYDKLSKFLEKQYSKLSENYIKTAQFSNGEAIYQKVK